MKHLFMIAVATLLTAPAFADISPTTTAVSAEQVEVIARPGRPGYPGRPGRPGRDGVTCAAQNRWGRTFYGSGWSVREAARAALYRCERATRFGQCRVAGCR